jgi:hypothetical protein
MRRFVFCALLLALAACSGTQTSAQGSPGAQTPGGDQVVAEIGGRKITLAELDQKWKTTDPAEQARVTQLLYQNRRNMLDQLIGDLLIDEAAKAAGMPPQQYLEQELPKRAQQVSDADVQAFFEQNKDRAQGRTIDQLRGPIREFLKSQREGQARAQLIDDLKKKHGGDLHVMLDPPRQTIELALHDPALGPASAPVTIVEFSDYQ